MQNLFDNMSHDTRIVLKTIFILSFILAILILVTGYSREQNDPDKLGHQFDQTDVDESPSSKLMTLSTICDATGEIVNALFEEGFLIESVGLSEDIQGNNFITSFWKKKTGKNYTVVLTSSYRDEDLTCIVSITKNVKTMDDSAQIDAVEDIKSTENP